MINCYIKHLKKVNELSADFKELTSILDITDCSSLLNEVKTELYTETLKSIGKEMDIKNKEQCVEENLKENKFFEATIKTTVYEVLHESFGRSYEKEIKEANDKLDSVIEDSTLYCIFKENFEESFDKLVAHDKQGEDLETDYCARKYIIDNHLLKPVYTLPLNPNNINTANVNCADKIKKLLKEIEDDLTDPDENNGVECKRKVFSDDKTHDKVVVTYFYNDLKMTPEQKAVEKKNYILLYGKIAVKTAECEE